MYKIFLKSMKGHMKFFIKVVGSKPIFQFYIFSVILTRVFDLLIVSNSNITCVVDMALTPICHVLNKYYNFVDYRAIALAI